MIRTILSSKYSKEGMMEIVESLKSNPQLIGELMACLFGEDPKIAQRAAWASSHVADQLPHLLEPHLDKMIYHLKQEGLHDSIPRNTVRTLQFLTIPEYLYGEVVSLCFDYLADPKSAVAVKCFSMSVIWKICQYEPDLAIELKLLIEEQMDYQSAGFKSRGKRILKEMRKKGMG